MCMGSPMAWTGAASGVDTAGTGLSLYGQWKQGQFEKRQASQAAKLQELKADMAVEQGEIKKQQTRRRYKQLVGAGLTAAAANGVMLEGERENSAMSIWEQDQAAQLAWDDALTDYDTKVEVWGFRNNAKAIRAQRDMDWWMTGQQMAGTMLSYGGRQISRWSPQAGGAMAGE